MMTALAQVTAVETKGDYQLVSVSCDQQTSCKSCQSKKSCGTGIVSNAIGSKKHHWQFKTQQNLQTGQIVEIGLPEKSLVMSALVVYVFPLIMMIIGSLLGEWVLNPWLQGGEATVIICFFVFGGLGIYFSQPVVRILEAKVAQEVHLIRSLGQSIATLQEIG